MTQTNTTQPTAAKAFPLGQIVATPGALAAFERNGQQPIEFLHRHAAGDWGEVCEEDKRANDHAVENGARILSAYTLTDGTKVWVITEADRASTAMLLPEEY